MVAATIARYALLEPGELVLAAVSGGRDSTALTLVLHDLGHPVVVAHVDHGMRPGSERDAARCAALAARMGARFRSVRLPVPPGGEAGARRARYEALEAMAAAAGAARIATGHTLDDAAETVAMRLGRGGAAIGIPPRRGAVVRPLVGIRRSDTEAVCRAAGVDWVDDPTNEDPRYRRNRLRRQAMPALAGRTAALAAVGTANAVLAQTRRAEAEALAAGIVTVAAGRAEIDRATLVAVPREVARALVRSALDDLGTEAGERAVADVVVKVAAVTGAGLDLTGGLRAWSDARRVVIGPAPAVLSLPPVPLAVPGRTVAPAWGLTVAVEAVDPARARAGHPSEAVVDAAGRGKGLVLRQRRPGDRLRPLGAPGTTSLQDLFVNCKVPREDRQRVPVIAAGNEIVWVGGLRIAHAWRVRPDSASALRIRLLAGPRRGAE